MDEENADALDEFFKKYKSTEYLKVDHTRLKDSCEAWVHVTLHYPSEKHAFFEGIIPDRGILTWPNSD